MTYLELKAAVLLQLGEDKNVTITSGTPVITSTTAVQGYIKQIPDLLREAATILATAGKYVINVHTETLTEADTIDTQDISDYYSLYEVYLDGERYNDYSIEGSRYLYFPNYGDVKIYYYAYPQSIGYDIEDADELVFDPEVYSLITMYICGKLRMFSDEDYASQVLSEFEQRRAELIAKGKSRASVVRGCVEW